MSSKHYNILFLLASVGIAIIAMFLIARVVQTPEREIPTHVTDALKPVSVPLVSETQAKVGLPAVEESVPVRILAVGDIMLGRTVERLMVQHGNQYPFEYVKNFFDEFDIVFANLEGPIPEYHVPTPNGSVHFSFQEAVAHTLVSSSVDIVSLANNHTLDYGPSGFEYTQEVLKSAGIQTVGHQRAVQNSYATAMNVDDQKIIFLAFNDVFGILDVSAADELIQETASTTDAFVFVSIHWGDEYKLVGNGRQQRIAHQLIDAGADVIIGHHPHVVQHVEVYNEKPIFYSLGNFIFDQYFSRNTQEGLAVEIELSEEDVKYTLYPIDIVESQPVVMEGDQKKEFLKNLAGRSEGALREDIKNGILSL